MAIRRRHRRSHIEIPNQLVVKWYQTPLWDYFNGPDGTKADFHNKRAMVFAHRRWGKDIIAVNLMAISAMLWPANYAYFFPLHTQARSALWENFDIGRGAKVMDLAFPEEIRRRTHNNHMFLELRNGSTIQLLSSDQYNAVMGTNFFGLVFSEWALSDAESWAYLRPVLSRNQGWALFITTPRGKNHAYDMLKAARLEPNWFTMVSTVNDTDAIPKEQQSIDEREYAALYGSIQGRAFFRQEYHCDFDAPILGAVYADALSFIEAEGRVRETKIERDYPVDTGWDLGVGDATAIWCIQRVANEYRLIAYYENSGAGLAHYAEKLTELKFKHHWQWGEHYFPHDVRNRELNTGTSRFDTLAGLGFHGTVVPAANPLDGFNAVRRLLDRAVIDPVRCAEGLDLLRNYKYEWKERQRVWTPWPRHDFASHCADALRTYAQGHDPHAAIRKVGATFRPVEPIRGPSHWAS